MENSQPEAQSPCAEHPKVRQGSGVGPPGRVEVESVSHGSNLARRMGQTKGKDKVYTSISEVIGLFTPRTTREL
jgi:hypothetical protein